MSTTSYKLVTTSNGVRFEVYVDGVRTYSDPIANPTNARTEVKSNGDSTFMFTILADGGSSFIHSMPSGLTLSTVNLAGVSVDTVISLANIFTLKEAVIAAFPKANSATGTGVGNQDLSGYQQTNQKGVAGGYAPLDANSFVPDANLSGNIVKKVGGKITAADLPSYVDDVVEVANFSALPGTGESGKIYVALDVSKSYRWSGSAYIRVDDVDLSGFALLAKYIVNEALTGTPNGTSTTFNLVNPPVAGKEMIMVNGLVQIRTTDYTISTTTVTFVTPPLTGDFLTSTYFKQ